MCRSVDDIKVVPLQKMDLSYKLLSVAWLNSRTMLFIDTSERSHLIDVRSEDDIEALDLADVRLVFSTSFYKSLATGSNVSPALAYAGERACYQSIVTSGSQLVLLGTKGIHVLVLRTWNERLDLLLKQGRYPEALSLSRQFYEGTAHCTIGLTGSAEKRHQVVAERIMTTLAAYVDLAMTKLCPSHGKMEELEAYYQVNLKDA
jgi:vacuolar protein sorting-associated protein 8